MTDAHHTAAALIAEIADLRAENTGLRHGGNRYIDALHDMGVELERLRAENAKLQRVVWAARQVSVWMPPIPTAPTESEMLLNGAKALLLAALAELDGGK